MLKKPSSRRSHPINATPFEVFYHGSWHGVEELSIKDGKILVGLNYAGSVIEDRIHGDNIRMRSRRASSFDCSQFLKPGVDVCVLSPHTTAASSGQELQTPLLSWQDAKIISIKRVPHVDQCACLFSVIFYQNVSPSSMNKSISDRRAVVITIHNIAVLQKLQNEPCEDGYYHWNSTEDCFSSSKSKLLSGVLSSEVSWLLVLSTLKGMDFTLKLMQNRIVYHILKTDQTPSGLTDVRNGNDCSRDSSYSNDSIKILCFEKCNESLQPKIETVAPIIPRKTFDPEETTEVDSVGSKVVSELDIEILYDHMGLRRSKRLKTQPDRFTSYYSPNFDRHSTRKMTHDLDSDDYQDASTTSALGSDLLIEEESTAAIVQKIISEGTDTDLHSHYPPGLSKAELKGLCRRVQRGSTFPSSDKIHHLSSLSYQKTGSNRRKLLSATECQRMIERCVGSIKCEMERQPEPTIQWTAHQETDLFEETEDFCWSPSAETHIENEEHEELWKEMEHSLTTLALLEKKQISDSEFLNGATSMSSIEGEQPCQHDYRLNEEIGIVCRMCNFVCTEIRNVAPPYQGNNRVTYKEKLGEELGWIRSHVLESFSNDVSFCDRPLSKMPNSVWSLIPDIESNLHSHQKEAFEFIWKKIAGSLKPQEMNHLSKDTGGCVISHSPGSGKTLLIISFLVSYLRLYPRSRPLVLAPKSAIYTWCKEFKKWHISIPVYLIHPNEGYGKDLLGRKTSMFVTDARRPNKKIMRVVTYLVKLRQWHEQPSILLMNYSSFFTLTKEDSKFEYKKFVASMLQRSPGLLVLDEGHNPRSTNSKLRKLLMKVKTEFRILLSGTLFQNNFEEYFNTLSLARPRFIRDTLSELDPCMVNFFRHRKQKGKTKINRAESLSRKMFVEKIGLKIESEEEEDRKQGFKLLNKVTSDFIDVYEGETSDTLPGLQTYALLLTSTELQRNILTKLQNSFTQKRCPLELEALISVGSIHPWLIKTVSCVNNYFSAEELGDVDKCKTNFGIGSKVKFVVDLVHKSTIRGERVLIFCHNISPINLLVELFELVFGWHRGEEVLVLQGDQELFVRARVMDQFNGDANGKSKVLLASTTACAEGISLTAASRLVMLDSEWNHSKTKQAIARAFRPGQEKVVYVYLLLASGTWEEDKYGRNARKAWMSKMIFRGHYIEYTISKQVEDINDELLRELVEDDQKRTIQMIMKHD